MIQRRNAEVNGTAGPQTTTRPSGRTRSGGFGGGGGGFGGGGGLGGGGFGGGGFAGGGAPSGMVTGPTCSLDATIYRLHLPADQIGRLDLNALNKASASADEFEKALKTLGSMTPQYRAGQSVRLAGDSISIGTSTPYVTASRVTDNGRSVNTVQYSNTGAIFNIAGRDDGGGRIELDLGIEISSMTDSSAEIGTGVKAPLHRMARMSHKGTVEGNKPFVVVSVDAASVDAEGKAVAYIARVTLGPPEAGGEMRQVR
jgi:hypothetical protein